jgi:hypothetical protein
MTGLSTYGSPAPVDKIVWYGDPPMEIPMNVTELTNIASFIAGRLGSVGSAVPSIATTDYDGYVCMNPVTHPPWGWIGYESVDTNSRPAYKEAAYASSGVGGTIPTTKFLRGRDFGIVASQYPYSALKLGDKVCNWYNGQVMGPCRDDRLGVLLGIPFSKSASETNTHVVIPAGMMVMPDSFIEVSTSNASGTIDVGFLNTGELGDADGLFKGALLSTVGEYGPTKIGAAGATGAESLGALLQSGAPTELKDANAVYFVLPLEGYKVPAATGNAVGSTVCYQTTNYTVAGKIWLHLVSPYIKVVGSAAESQTTTTTAKALKVTSELG